MVYELGNELIFPDPGGADKSGLLAIGGDLSLERLILAYSQGIFPWFSENEPIMWWSPDPRMIIYPRSVKISKSLDQALRNKNFEVRFDTVFENVIRLCSRVERHGQPGTWITNEMISAYIALHNAGFAHSVETFIENRLVGGLYGVSLGKCFCGESMFHLERDASKVAFVKLADRLEEWDFEFIDAQLPTRHLKSLGGLEISRNKFLDLLQESLKFPTRKGKW